MRDITEKAPVEPSIYNIMHGGFGGRCWGCPGSRVALLRQLAATNRTILRNCHHSTSVYVYNPVPLHHIIYIIHEQEASLQLPIAK